jgi:uncharacterized membrane protein (DUF485 family)
MRKVDTLRATIGSGSRRKTLAGRQLDSTLTISEPGEGPAGTLVLCATAPSDSLSAEDLVREIARRRHAVAHPLFLGSFLFFCAALVAFAYLPGLVGTKIFGAINVAYLLALAQFVVTFVVAGVYARWARSAIDPLTAQARLRLGNLAREVR